MEIGLFDLHLYTHMCWNTTAIFSDYFFLKDINNLL